MFCCHNVRNAKSLDLNANGTMDTPALAVLVQSQGKIVELSVNKRQLNTLLPYAIAEEQEKEGDLHERLLRL